MGKNLNSEFMARLTALHGFLIKCPRKSANIVAKLYISFYGTLILYYIYNALLSVSFLVRYGLTLRPAWTLDLCSMEYHCSEVYPTDVISSTVYDTFVAIVFVYFNYKLMKATNETNTQSITNWLLFHSLHLTCLIIYYTAYGLIKKSPQHLIMVTLNSITYGLPIWIVKRFYDKVRKLNAYKVTLAVKDPALCKTEEII